MRFATKEGWSFPLRARKLQVFPSRGGWHGLCLLFSVKVAIPLYRDRVAPRLGFAREALVVTFRGEKEEKREIVDLSAVPPLEVPRLLAEKGVTVLIAGGVEGPLASMLRAHRIEVIWGIIGEVEDVLALYRSDGLRTGMGPCRRRRRSGGGCRRL